MARYFIQRTFFAAATLLGVAALVFILLRIMPGDIVEAKLLSDGGMVSAETIEAERKRLGLDKPLGSQFVEWMHGVVTFDYGKSMWTGRPVSQEIGLRLGLSFQLAVMSTIVGVMIALPLGAFSAIFRDTWFDHLARAFAIGGMAVPSFWFGMLILLGLVAYLNWIPPSSYKPFYVDPWHNISQLFWPALATGYRLAGVLSRIIRSSLLEVLNEDYIRTARAKGVWENRILWRHAMRNALLPAITVIGLEFAFLMGGLVVMEQVFNLNGVGKLLVQAVERSDFTLIQGIVMMSAMFYVAVSLLIDVLYALLDPRIRLR